jgi:predicted acetyltransferase
LPFFIRVDTKLAGFALIRQGAVITAAPAMMDIAEFCILQEWRRRSIGRSAAHTRFRQFSGRWEVRVSETKVAALPFWEQTVASLCEAPLSVDAMWQRQHLLAGVPPISPPHAGGQPAPQISLTAILRLDYLGLTLFYGVESGQASLAKL